MSAIDSSFLRDASLIYSHISDADETLIMESQEKEAVSKDPLERLQEIVRDPNTSREVIQAKAREQFNYFNRLSSQDQLLAIAVEKNERFYLSLNTGLEFEIRSVVRSYERTLAMDFLHSLKD